MNDKLKEKLEFLVKKYESKEFILDDPIQFPHRYKNKEDIEISAFVSSCLAYGQRSKIIESLNTIHSLIKNNPYKFCLNYKYEEGLKIFKGFKHRFTTGEDIALLFLILSNSVKKHGSLEKLFMKNFSDKEENIRIPLTKFVEELFAFLPEDICTTRGLLHLIPSPAKGSACKRLNLFLKWMVRKPPVDFNLWQSINSSILLMPLDTHVAKIGRIIKLTNRSANDWITAEEITANLAKYDKNDPVKYDFAIFGAGVNKDFRKLDDVENV